MRHILSAIVFLLILSSCNKIIENQKIELSSNWVGYSNSGEDTLKVDLPMSLLDLFYKNQKIEDLHFDDNATGIYIDYEKKWTISKVIPISEEKFSYSSILFIPDGLSGNCTIYINEVFIGSIKGNEFISEIEIREHLKLGENELKIVFDPLFDVKNTSWNSFQNLYIAGNEFSPSHLNATLFNAKLQFSNKMAINGHFIESVSFDKGNPEFQFTMDYRNDSRDGLTIHLNVPDLNINLVSKQPAGDSLNFVSFQFSIPKDALWYPYNLGESKLYEASIVMESDNGLRDERKINIGFNAHQWRKVDEAYHYYINNNLCPVKAVELSPASIYLPEGSDIYWRKLLKELKDLGINGIKLNSDNFYAPSTLLNLCDSVGILVWQDLNYQRPTEQDISQRYILRNNITRKVLQFRSHSSVMALGVGNIKKESIQGMVQLSETEKRERLKGDIEMFEYVAPKITSMGSGLQFFSNSDSFWNFELETRTPSLPEFTYLDLWMSELEKDPNGKTFKAHAPKGWVLENLYDSIVQFYTYPIDLEALIYFSELYQKEKLKSYLSERGDDKLCLLPLTYNEMWPGISPSIQTFYGTRKAVFYELLKDQLEHSFELEEKGNQVHVYMKNNSGNTLQGVVEVALYDLLGNLIEKDKFPLQLSTGNRGEVFSKQYDGSLKNKIAKVRYIKSNEVIYEQTFDFIPFSEPYLPLPSPGFRVVTEEGSNYLELFSDSYMKEVKLSANHLGYFKENYFNLFPGDTLKIPFISEDQSYPLQVEEVNVYSYYQSYE